MTDSYSAGDGLNLLKNWVASPDIVTGSKMLKLTTQLAGAVKHTHSHGIMHRDIKPDNILVRQNGDILLSDFGCALKRTTEEPARDTVWGTSDYMAPELYLTVARDGTSLYNFKVGLSSPDYLLHQTD